MSASIPLYARVKLLDGREGFCDSGSYGVNGTRMMKIILDSGEVFEAQEGYIRNRVPRKQNRCIDAPVYQNSGHPHRMYPWEVENLLKHSPGLARRQP